MEDLPKSTGGDFAGRKPIGGLRKNQSRYRLTASTRTLPTVPARPAHCRGRPHACGVILLLSLASPRTGGPHACHYRTAGSDSCARRRGSVAARGTGTADADAGRGAALGRERAGREAIRGVDPLWAARTRLG